MKKSIYKFTEGIRDKRGSDNWRGVKLVSGDKVEQPNTIGVCGGVETSLHFNSSFDKVITYKKRFPKEFDGLVEFEVWH